MSETSLAGTPDCFERLWTPYRLAYIQGTEQGCPFCRAPELSDAEGLIVCRGKLAYVIMNLYPYSPGHMLVCPYRHTAVYTDLTAPELAEIDASTQSGIATLSAISAPAGFNLGLNQGAVAGAGVAGHLHQHIVPRWSGDTNFLPIVAQTRALPQLLGDARDQLADHWR